MLGLVLAGAALTGCSASGAAPSAPPPPQPSQVSVDAYLDAVSAGQVMSPRRSRPVSGLRVTYLGEETDAVTISTRYDGPHLWWWDGLDDYETAAKAHLCPR